MTNPGPVEAASAFVYEGVWGVLAGLLRTPREAPSLPTRAGEANVAIKPSKAWLAYLKFFFWLGLTVIDVAIIGTWLLICYRAPLLGAALAAPAWILAIVPDIFAYVAIYLRYDTTWYVVSPRAIRLRNGIWNIRETTFTFENVQNVEVTQGPLERWFGFANLKVETAGGSGHGEHGAPGSNVAYLFGLDNAQQIRELIMDRVRASKSTGLGDEHHDAPAQSVWSPAQLAELRAMRDRLRAALAG
ncbi:MAG: PH domain-containing protein [Phycisphaerales bacterium]|nr:PH domain-containing protein [Planctomycetota bacterium]